MDKSLSPKTYLPPVLHIIVFVLIKSIPAVANPHPISSTDTMRLWSSCFIRWKEQIHGRWNMKGIPYRWCAQRFTHLPFCNLHESSTAKFSFKAIPKLVLSCSGWSPFRCHAAAPLPARQPNICCVQEAFEPQLKGLASNSFPTSHGSAAACRGAVKMTLLRREENAVGLWITNPRNRWTLLSLPS